MKLLRTILEDTDTKLGKYFALFIQSLIVLSLISFSIETIPNLSSGTKHFLKTMEFCIIGIFTFEYFCRLLISDKKLSFIFSFYGIVDLIAIIPFYISTGLDLRSLRAFRLLRLFVIFKLIRYNKAMGRFKKALTISREELILFGFIAMILLFLSSVGIFHFENGAQPDKFKSIFHSMWWAIATLTTVGYGDIYPITVGGKIFTFFMLIIGLGVVAVPTGIVASALSKVLRDEYQDDSRQ